MACRYRTRAAERHVTGISLHAARTARLSPEATLAGLCLLYVLAAFAVAPACYPLVLFEYAKMMATVLPALLPIVILLLGIFRNPQSPLSGTRATLRDSLIPGLAVIAVFLLAISAFTTLKFSIPSIVPFYADPMLANLDETLHGAAPWRLAHAVSPDWMPAAIGFLYARFWFIQWLGMLALVAFWGDRTQRARYLWSFALTVGIVGTLLATLLSSVGPILYDQFYEGRRFSGLLDALNASKDGGIVVGYADYLLESYRAATPRFATGISAMPSMHVAVAVLNALFLARLNRWAGVYGWLFAAAILFGSVWTGWHHAVDGYVSIVVVSLIWWASGRALAADAPGATCPAAPAGR